MVTRALLTCYMITGLTSLFRLLPLGIMYHSWSLIFKLPIPEIWRLFANFLFIGGPSINFLFQLVWLYVTSSRYYYFDDLLIPTFSTVIHSYTHIHLHAQYTICTGYNTELHTNLPNFSAIQPTPSLCSSLA